MPKYKIQGKTCSFDLNLPKYLDQNTKNILIDIFGYCLNENIRNKVLVAIEVLLGQTNSLIASLQQSKKHNKSVEAGIREFIGIHLKHGFDIGTYYTPREEGPELIEVIANQYDYNPITANLPKSKKSISEVIFYCLDLARLAIETGLMLSYYLSEELVEKNQEEIRKAISYIG